MAPLAGALSENWNRRRALLITQSLAMTQALVLGTLTLGGWVRIEHVLILGLCQGVVNAFDLPIRQAFLQQMVPHRADLPNAIALNLSMVNGARLVGPAVAALLIEAVGEGWCFAINSLSYLAVLAALSAMRIEHVRKAAAAEPVWQSLQGGIRYAFARRDGFLAEPRATARPGSADLRATRHHSRDRDRLAGQRAAQCSTRTLSGLPPFLLPVD